MRMRKKILMTGASGILGGILAGRLASEYEIHGLDKTAAPGAGVGAVDISDLDRLREAFGRLPGLDAVVHFAADPYPFASWELVLKHNIIGTRNVYECCRLHGVDRVVFASSTHVVGKYEGYPFRIEGKGRLTPLDPMRPDGFYGLSKAVGELIARTYHDLHGIASICLRIGHVSAGQPPDPDLEKLELEPDDLVALVRAGIESKIGFGVYFAISDVEGSFLDLSGAVQDLGYRPSARDTASSNRSGTGPKR
jgi:NAD+ dependent glucose-6-phosphate dehydrogenase